uniref:Uncharacterized protein n=1 Tax=Eubacterium plexicaudatum ASF492 TaxID=1235802 RepID=N1ZZN4_9FIRM
MSFILSVCGNNYSIMLGDGQETIKNGELYIPVKKDYKKVLSINDNVCIGFAGDTAIVKQIVSELNNYKNSTIRQIKDSILEKVKTKSLNDFGLKYIISGKDDGNFITYYYSNKDNFCEHKFEPCNQAAVVYASPVDVNEKIIENIVKNYVYDNIPRIRTTEQLLGCMCQCIIEVSKVSNTVNDYISGEKIF